MGQTYQNPVPQIGNTSGLFGDLRGNHFHSGIDYPTFGDGKTPILAVYNGHVSRIKISATGFGNALYIKHPTGYTSVYAHLHSFNQKIAQWVKAKQYQLESFEMDVFPNETELQIVKGEIIGLGGNTGNST
ncbi:MAG: M23 family metallopeptidase, partial [Bacteroidota bacterium]